MPAALPSSGAPESSALPRVIAITGVMAAGKSTVAQLLAERLDRSVHVRGDLYRRIGLWLDTTGQSPEQTVDEILARLPKALVRSGV